MLKTVFPPKCILCHKILNKHQTDMCHQCRKDAPEANPSKRSIPFVAKWSSLWYYKESVRSSIHRFKFSRVRSYAGPYGRLLALKLQQTDFSNTFDTLTWVPISARRRFRRGYDQCQLLAKALGRELGCTPVRTLKKIRHTPPQSTLRDAAQRRANILGAYAVTNPEAVAGKRILLVDDVLTTGATASECAKMLMTAGAEKVYFICLATPHETNQNKRR